MEHMFHPVRFIFAKYLYFRESVEETKELLYAA